MTHLPSTRPPSAGVRGAALVQYVLLMGLVALAATVGMRAFGGSVSERTGELAVQLRHLDDPGRAARPRLAGKNATQSGGDATGDSTSIGVEAAAQTSVEAAAQTSVEAAAQTSVQTAGTNEGMPQAAAASVTARAISDAAEAAPEEASSGLGGVLLFLALLLGVAAVVLTVLMRARARAAQAHAPG